MINRLAGFVHKFRGIKVLVIGDIYLDEYIWGDMAEISKEGPIPVIHIISRNFYPGAAGNTAAGISTLGGDAYLAGFVGKDSNGTVLINELKKYKVHIQGILTVSHLPTNTYTKISGGGFHSPKQEVLRTDTQRPPFIDKTIEDKLISYMEKTIPRIDGVILMDQANSVITPRIIKSALKLTRKYKKLLVGDSRDNTHLLKGFDVIVPNEYEAGTPTGITINSPQALQKVGVYFRKNQHVKNVVITLGKEGIACFDTKGKMARFPTAAQEVVDVTGAGDSVTAAVSLGLLAGGTLEEATMLGNFTAAKAVAVSETYRVTAKDLIQAIEGEEKHEKIQTEKSLKEIIAKLHKERKKVAWTNGCFDILHAGHIDYLEKAKAQGDVLIVGLNDDKSVRRIKGKGRPIIPESQRAKIISSLACVDYVILFSKASPKQLLISLKPDVYVKGGDYTIDTINQPERRICEKQDTRIEIIPLISQSSTTSIIGSILDKHKK